MSTIPRFDYPLWALADFDGDLVRSFAVIGHADIRKYSSIGVAKDIAEITGCVLIFRTPDKIRQFFQDRGPDVLEPGIAYKGMPISDAAGFASMLEYCKKGGCVSVAIDYFEEPGNPIPTLNIDKLIPHLIGKPLPQSHSHFWPIRFWQKAAAAFIAICVAGSLLYAFTR